MYAWKDELLTQRPIKEFANDKTKHQLGLKASARVQGRSGRC